MAKSFLILPELAEMLNKLELYSKGELSYQQYALYLDAKFAIKSLIAIERSKQQCTDSIPQF